MQQPADMACNVACAVMRDMSRTASFMLETQIDLSHLRLKMAEAALEDVRELEHELGGTHDWTSLASAQHLHEDAIEPQCDGLEDLGRVHEQAAGRLSASVDGVDSANAAAGSANLFVTVVRRIVRFAEGIL